MADPIEDDMETPFNSLDLSSADYLPIWCVNAPTEIEFDPTANEETDHEKWKQVLDALSNPQWDFRTISGISKETGLPDQEVDAIINKHREQIRKSIARDNDGKELFTLQERPIKGRELLAAIQRLLSMPLSIVRGTHASGSGKRS